MQPIQAKQFKQWRIGGLALILFIAIALRVWQLGTQSLWHDEAWSVFSGYNPFAPMGIRGADLNAPAAYYSTLAVWMRLVGDSVWAMRFLSALYGMLTVAFAAFLTRRFFGSSAAFIASLLIALNPILWVFSQEIRAYVTMPLAALGFLFLLDKILQEHVHRRWWIWLVLVEFFTLYAHNLSVPLVAWLNVTAVLALVIMRRWRRLATWIIVQFGLLIAYLPWLLTQKQTGTALNNPPPISAQLLWDIWQSFFTGIRTMINADGLLSALVLAMGIIALVALLIVLIRQRTLRLWLLISQVILIPVFEVGIIYAAHIDFHPRYFIVSVPATLILIALGASQLMHARGSIPSSGRLPRLIMSAGYGLAIGVLALGLAILVRMTSVLYGSPVYQHDDYRAIAERYAKLGSQDRIVIPYGWEPTLDYYSHHMNFKAPMIEIPLHSPSETIQSRLLTELQGVSRVELLTWYQLPADVRGAYSCILGAIGHPDDSLTVNGLTTQAFSHVDPAQSRLVDLAQQSSDSGQIKNNFGSLLLNATKALVGVQSTCIISDWELAQSSPDDWRIVARLQNSLGWDLGQSDRLLMDDRQLTTTRWKVGATGTAYSLIQLPNYAPSKESYQAMLKVYSDQSTQPLPVLNVDTPDPKPELKLPVAITDLPIASPDSAEVQTPPNLLQPITISPSLAVIDLEGLPTVRTMRQGDILRVTLTWQLQGNLAPNDASVTVRLAGGGWAQTTKVMLSNVQPIQLSWQEFTVPLDATGDTQLYINDVPLGNIYHIEAIPRQYNEPGMLIVVRPEAHFSTFATLVGVTASWSPLASGVAFPVTLLWRAEGTSTLNFKVFVHLIDSTGQVVAQSDSEPADGIRPFRTWLAGEYITETPMLRWNRDFHGTASLTVGLYDPATMRRVQLADGTDEVIIPVQLEVK